MYCKQLYFVQGKKYSIWHLTGLDDCTKHVSLFLFGKIHEDLWRNVTVGTVIGLLNPSIMPPKREDHASGKRLVVLIIIVTRI